MKTKRKRRKAVLVPMEGTLLKKIDDQVEEHFPNRSEFIREACRQYLEKLSTEEKDSLYEKGYQKQPEKSDWPKGSHKILSQVWSKEDWS